MQLVYNVHVLMTKLGNHFVIWGRFNGAKCKEEVFELEGYRNDAIQDFICHANFLLILTGMSFFDTCQNRKLSN
jgi:hypothetical protein